MAITGRGITLQDMFPGTDLCLMPAGTAPDSSPSNLRDAPSLKPTVIAISSVMLALAFVVFAGRIMVNWKTLKVSDCRFGTQLNSDHVLETISNSRMYVQGS